MKNNIFYKTCFVLAVSASLIGCSSNTDSPTPVQTTISESVSIAVDDTEPATEHVDSTKPAEQNAIVTINYFLNDELPGKGNAHYDYRHAFCFETQYYPDAVHKPEFPSPILKAGQEYKTTTIYKFLTV